MKKLHSKIQFAADAADDTAAVRYFLLTLLKNENEELVLLLQIQSHKSINIINTHSVSLSLTLFLCLRKVSNVVSYFGIGIFFVLFSLCFFLCLCLCFSVSLCVSLCLLLSLCFFFFLCFLVFRSTRKVSNVVSYFDLVFIVTFFVLSSLCLSVSVSLSLCISVSVSVFLFLPLFTCFQVNNTEGLKCCKLF